MAEEIKSQVEDIRWPEGVRLPVVLTFEHQSGEGAPLFAGERPNYMVGGAMQYGARRGIWNVLELLDKYKVTATFFVLGTTAERYADTVQAIAKAGHEIAGMGYGFESIRYGKRRTGALNSAAGFGNAKRHRGYEGTRMALSGLSSKPANHRHSR